MGLSLRRELCLRDGMSKNLFLAIPNSNLLSVNCHPGFFDVRVRNVPDGVVATDANSLERIDLDEANLSEAAVCCICRS